MKSMLFTVKEAHLMSVILLIPDVFESVLIFENEEIENFDIGFKDFWLKTRKNTEWKAVSYSEYADEYRKNISVSEVPIEETDDYIVYHWTKRYFSKPVNGNGEIWEQGCYRNRILKHLEYLKTK